MKSLLLACFGVGALYGSTVTGPLYLANGQRFAGSCTISWPAFNTADGRPVLSGSNVVAVQSGALSVQLEPTDTAQPRFVYRVECSGAKQTQTEYWSVPTGGSWTVAQVRASMVSPSTLVQLGQINVTAIPAGTYCVQVAGGVIVALVPCNSGEATAQLFDVYGDFDASTGLFDAH
jgi:hypothetical protein